MNIKKVPKYSLPEIERRWLPIAEKLPDLETLEVWNVEDHYINNSRMRLRKINIPGDESTMRYKLCKKYGKISDINEPITNIYLTREEYELLLSMESKGLLKKKYKYMHEGTNFVISTFDESGIITVEAEFKSEEEARNAKLPDFIGKDISASVEYESATIA